MFLLKSGCDIIGFSWSGVWCCSGGCGSYFSIVGGLDVWLLCVIGDSVIVCDWLV